MEKIDFSEGISYLERDSYGIYSENWRPNNNIIMLVRFGPWKIYNIYEEENGRKQNRDNGVHR